jgi:hypothetical protein
MYKAGSIQLCVFDPDRITEPVPMQSGMSLAHEAEVTHVPPYPSPEDASHVRAAWHSVSVLTCVDHGGHRCSDRQTPRANQNNGAWYVGGEGGGRCVPGAGSWTLLAQLSRRCRRAAVQMQGSQ